MPYTFDRYLNIRSALDPVLSPSGERVAFLSDITGNYQVWSVGLADEAEQGWPRQLTFFPDKVWELHATPVADHLIAVRDVNGNERQQLYLITNYGETDGHNHHNVRRLTKNDDAMNRFGAWRRDGQAILYTSNARNGRDFDLYMLEIATGDSRLIAEMAGNRAVVAWAPDGKEALVVDALASEQIELSVVDIQDGSERSITAGQPSARYMALKWTERALYTLSDRDCDRFALCELSLDDGALTEIVAADELLNAAKLDAGELEHLAIANNGETAVVGINIEGYSTLYRVDLRNGDWHPINGLPKGLISHVRFGTDGAQLVVDLQNPQHNPDIWTVDPQAGKAVRRTFSNMAGIDSTSLVTPELVHFETFDGLEIPAFFYRPMQTAPASGFPCILYVHGGPAGQQRPDFDVRFQYFLGQGYAILSTNVRGSTGYGRAYMMADDIEKRMDSVTDLKYAVRWLHEQDDVDATRIAIYGRSYGGFMVLAALTEYPELFAAGIDVVGIANWVTFLERTSAWRRAHREREYGSLALHRDLLEQISPIHRAERIQMPLLVLAGDNDPRVPLYESEQVVDRVRAAGGSVEFIHYADEGHRFSKLVNRIDSFNRMADFLKRALG